jgi:nucleoside-triphosphatase THEP1
MKIIIEGDCAEGKTTIAAHIAHALRAAGIGVRNNDIDVRHESDYPTLQGTRLASLKDKKITIDIETVQVRKGTR